MQALDISACKMAPPLFNLRAEHNREPRVLLLIAGHSGQVGSALLKQLEVAVPRLRQERGFTLHVAALVNRCNILWRDPDNGGETHEPRRPCDWPEILTHFVRFAGTARLLVDCTADAELARHHIEFLRRNVAVVTANKLALCGMQREYHALMQAADRNGIHYSCETAVAAALPVLEPVRDIRVRGERVLRMEALVSGTLSFILQRVNNGTPFSVAVREACARGYTERHPAEDIKGNDTGRKLLILLRTAGIHWEPEAIPVESLVPKTLVAEPDVQRFLAGLSAYDADWFEKTEAARQRGLRLVYLARFDGRGVGVGVTHVSAQDPFALLAPGENLIRIWTDRYQPVPLSISGPGAGPELTAAGVLTDILKATRELLHG